MMGKSAINDGKIDGDNVSFNITIDLGGNQMKVEYTGKVAGKEMKLTAHRPAATTAARPSSGRRRSSSAPVL